MGQLENVSFLSYDSRFDNIIGELPTMELALQADYPFAHEAGVYIPHTDSVFVTSNQFNKSESEPLTIVVNELTRQDNGLWKKSEIDCNIPMANGAVNYGSGALFCAQGDQHNAGGLVWMDSLSPYSTSFILDNYNGRWFNSLNDVVVKSDGSIWFTDPAYGFEQGIRPAPQLPSQVYRFNPTDGDLRVVADGLGRPNGLAFSPDEETMYLTDTDWIHGDGTKDATRPSTMYVSYSLRSHIIADSCRYAFDVVRRGGADFLANRRTFAMADTGAPDGIKCDTLGNVYAGCGDGLNVWSPGGTLLGKILVPGGVANFCFGRRGEIFLLNEDKFWVAKVDQRTEGAILAHR